MNGLFGAAAELEAFCAERGWRSAVIGGVAVQRWGEPRQTRDVGVALLTGMGGEIAYIDPLLAHYRARVEDARRFALTNRIVLVETDGGVPLDISLAALPYEERLLGRASAFQFEPDVAVTTCSAEDLIVLKVVAGRVQDWLDVEGIIVRQGTALDRALVTTEARALLERKDDAESLPKLQALFEKHRGS